MTLQHPGQVQFIWVLQIWEIKYERILDFHFSRHYNNILVALHPLFGAGEDNGTRDNAAGAVARMITTKPHVLPLNQVDTMVFHHINHAIHVINLILSFLSMLFCWSGIRWFYFRMCFRNTTLCFRSPWIVRRSTITGSFMLVYLIRILWIVRAGQPSCPKLVLNRLGILVQVWQESLFNNCMLYW